MAQSVAMRKYQSWVQQQTAVTGRAPSESERRRMLQTFLQSEQASQAQAQQFGLAVRGEERLEEGQDIQQAQFAETTAENKRRFDITTAQQEERDAAAKKAGQMAGVSNLAMTGLAGKYMYDKYFGAPKLASSGVTNAINLPTVPQTPAIRPTSFGQQVGPGEVGTLGSSPTATAGETGLSLTPTEHAAGYEATSGAAGGAEPVAGGFSPTVGHGLAVVGGISAGYGAGSSPGARSLAQGPAGQRLNQRQAGAVSGAGAGALAGTLASPGIGTALGATFGARAGFQAAGGEGEGEFFGEVGAIPSDILGFEEPGELSRFGGDVIDAGIPNEVQSVLNDVVSFVGGSCLLFSHLYGSNSDQVKCAQRYCKKKMHPETLVGYYQVAKRMIIFCVKYPWATNYAERLAETLYDFMQYEIGELNKISLTKRVIGHTFLAVCSTVKKLTATKRLFFPIGSEVCIKAATRRQ